MGMLFERFRDAWSALQGVQRATLSSRSDQRPDRLGSAPEISDEDFRVLSAAFEFYKHYTHLEPDRISIYDDMDEMFQYVLAGSGLDIYTEEALQSDAVHEKIMSIESPNPQVKAELERLFENLEFEERVKADMWGLGKYGDEFSILRYNTKIGVYDAIPIEPRICWRHEDARRVLLGYSIGDTSETQAADAKQDPQWKPWDMIHSRLRGRRVTNVYGTPLFMSVRLVYKMLKLMEEQMTIYRMKMHPDRLLYKIFTGDANVEERRRVVRMWKREMERMFSVNHDTEQFTSEFGPWAVDSDIYFPVGSNDSQSGVEKFPGSSNAGDIFDIEYMRDLFFSGIKVPKGYLGFEDSQGYRADGTLSQQSVRFARGVKVFQQGGIKGWAQLAKVHLELRGVDTSNPANSFKLKFAPVTVLDEIQRQELTMKRFETVNYLSDMAEKLELQIGLNKKLWMSYVLKEYAGLGDAEITRFTTKAGAGGLADLNFEPASLTAVFEQCPEKRAEFAQFIAGNEEFQHYLTEVMKVGLLTPASGSSKDDKFDAALKEKFKKGTESDDGQLDKALQLNEDAKGLGEKRAQERTKRLREAIDDVRKKSLQWEKETGK